MVVLIVLCLDVEFCVRFHVLTEWSPIGKIAAYSAYNMFS